MPQRLFTIIVLSVLVAPAFHGTAANGYNGERLEALRHSPGSVSMHDPSPPAPPAEAYRSNSGSSLQNGPAATSPGTMVQSAGGPALRPQTPKRNRSLASSPLDRVRRLAGGRSLSTMLGGLAIALGAFLLLAWALRRGMPKAAHRLPTDVIEVLGHATLTPKQSVHLVRLGRKLLLVSVTPSGAETLAEIADPDQVTHLISLCVPTHRKPSQTAFHHVLDELGTRH